MFDIIRTPFKIVFFLIRKFIEFNFVTKYLLIGISSVSNSKNLLNIENISYIKN